MKVTNLEKECRDEFNLGVCWHVTASAASIFAAWWLPILDYHTGFANQTLSVVEAQPLQWLEKISILF